MTSDDKRDDDNDWIHPVNVGRVFADYDFDSTAKSDSELYHARVEFSYHNRSSDTFIDRVGTITDLDGREDGVYWICVETDGEESDYHIDDIGVVRSPARSRALLGELTSLEIDDEDS